MKLLVQGEFVYDGLGSPPETCGIMAENGIITDMGPHLARHSAPVIPGNGLTVVKGKTVCPGFIDIHRHADSAVFTRPDFGRTELLQGITGVVSGNCGLSPVPGNHRWRREYYRYIEPVTGSIPPAFPDDTGSGFPADYGSYRGALEKLPLPVNFGFLAASGAIRAAVKGFSGSSFSPEEMAGAKRLINEAFDAGALGLSLGLMYQPECFTGHDEFTALLGCANEAAKKQGAIVCVHIRGEGDSLVSSVDEVISLAEVSGLPFNISHFKSTGIKNWRNLIFRAIEKIESARGRGLQITADFYPYDGGSTTILSLIPPSFLEDGIEKFCAELSSRNRRDQLRRELNADQSRAARWDNMAAGIGWDRIIISSVSLPEHESLCGKSMEAAAAETGCGDPVDLLSDLAAGEMGRTGIITLSMDQGDIDTAACLPWTCLISDSLYSSAGSPHPRLNGAFPKFLREYVREKKILSMQEAIHKMTGMPARRMGLMNRGILRKNCPADILVFDSEIFTDNAGYSSPNALAAGMETVILNGQMVYNNGSFTGSGGCVLTRG